MAKITKKMVLGDVIAKHPETIEVFFKNGLHCAMCGMASQETIEQAVEAHGMKLEKLLKDLNKVIVKKK